jgi:2-polyprenyl-3-methyl-5-hydroxy-6-metoxy-1,4-benzoquinol methylase
MKLGLPLEYKKLPEFFDAHNINDDTKSKNIALEKLLKKYKVKTVFDITCGTGSQVFFLHKKGYKVIGSDLCHQLIKIANKKSKDEKLNLKFLQGDMRKVHLGEFDGVISMFNAIGHLSKNDFVKSIKNIANNLKPNGIYIFDILNIEALNDEIVANFFVSKSKKIANKFLHSIQCSTIDKVNSLLTSYDVHVLQIGAEKPINFKNKFSLKIYNQRELNQILEACGFEVVEQCDIDGSIFIPKKSLSILTVAKRIG